MKGQGRKNLTRIGRHLSPQAGRHASFRSARCYGWLITLIAFTLAGHETQTRAAETTFANHRPGFPELSSEADLTPVFEQLGFERRKQERRGTCSVFTVTAALEFALARSAKPQRLSVEFLNWAANEATGSATDGGFFSDMWKGFAKYGICAEGEMPYCAVFSPTNRPGAEALNTANKILKRRLQAHWIKDWDVKTGLTEDHLKAIKRTLSTGWPVCAGLRWPRQEQWKEGVLQMCAPDAVLSLTGTACCLSATGRAPPSLAAAC